MKGFPDPTLASLLYNLRNVLLCISLDSTSAKAEPVPPAGACMVQAALTACRQGEIKVGCNKAGAQCQDTGAAHHTMNTL